MNYKQVLNELERIHCTSYYVGNIEGLTISTLCPDEYIQIYNDMESVLIPYSEIDYIFKQFPDKCGLRFFWNIVKNNSSCRYFEYLND